MHMQHPANIEMKRVIEMGQGMWKPADIPADMRTTIETMVKLGPEEVTKLLRSWSYVDNMLDINTF